MFKVLIVEDEMFVRLGIKASIDWEKLGMEVVADAEDGQAAWTAYQEHKPHLILTDIKMPVMDGITLIEKIRERDSRVKIVILSCLEEFELVRKALVLGVSDYILKLTMSQAEMESVLNKVRNELADEVSPKADGAGGGSSEISKETLFFNYLLYGTYTDKQFEQQISRSKIELAPVNLVSCMMEIDNYNEVQKKFDDEQGRLIRFTFLNIINELLNIYARGISLYESDNRYVIFFSFFDVEQRSKIMDMLDEILEHIKRVMKSYLNCSVSFGVSSVQNGYPSLRKLYGESINAINCKYFFGLGETIIIGRANPESIKVKVTDKLADMLESIRVIGEESCSELKMEFDAYMENFSASRAHMKKLFIRLGHWLLMTNRLNSESMSDLVMDYTQQVELCETLDQSISTFIKYLNSVYEIKTAMKSYSKEVIKVIKYVQENYDNEFSLGEIAGMVELSPNYLCSLFKKEMGIGLSEYLMRYRIEKAKYLLKNTNMKAYEVAIKVGYGDESYFSRSFKKITGMRPNDFKKKWVHV